MPNIFVKVPKDAFPAESRSTLLREITNAAATAEKIPDSPKNRFTTWVLVEEIDTGAWACGGQDYSETVLPCIAVVLVPSGVIDQDSRASYVKLLHEAFQRSVPATETRRIMSSIVLQDIAEGTWGGNGTIWTLPTLAKAAGYMHLQHL